MVVCQRTLQIALFCTGFNVETVEYKNISFTVWDVGGQDKVLQRRFQIVTRHSCYRLPSLTAALAVFRFDHCGDTTFRTHRA